MTVPQHPNTEGVDPVGITLEELNRGDGRGSHVTNTRLLRPTRCTPNKEQGAGNNERVKQGQDRPSGRRRRPAGSRSLHILRSRSNRRDCRRCHSRRYWAVGFCPIYAIFRTGTKSPNPVVRLMDSDDAPVLIDIRSAGERGSEMIPGSLHVPLDVNFASNIETLDTDNRYLLYCATGVRSRRAVRALQRATSPGSARSGAESVPGYPTGVGSQQPHRTRMGQQHETTCRHGSWPRSPRRCLRWHG